MKRILLFLPVVFTFTQIHAQKEYDLLGKGARAAGMAYAFNAVADDATAISWNPAGIVQIKKPEIALSLNRKATKYSHEIYDNRVNKTLNTLDYLGFVYPLKIKTRDLVFGAGFQNQMNYKATYYPNEESEINDYDYNNNLTVNSVSFCAALSVTRYLGLGISFNKWFSMGNKADEYDYYYSKMIDDANYEFDELFINATESFKYKGLNVVPGIFLDLSPYKIPLRFSVKYASKFLLENDYDVASKLRFAFTDDNDSIIVEESKGYEKYYFPGMIGLGLSYRYGDYLTVACDYDIRPFKNKQYIFDYGWDQHYFFDNQNPPAMDLKVQYHDEYYLLKSNSNLNQFRIGAEYILHPKFALIPLRIGWKNNPTSISSYDSYGKPVKQVYAHSINAGTGYISKLFSIDFSYERYRYDRMDINYWKEKVVYHFFDLSLIFHIK